MKHKTQRVIWPARFNRYIPNDPQFKRRRTKMQWLRDNAPQWLRDNALEKRK